MFSFSHVFFSVVLFLLIITSVFVISAFFRPLLSFPLPTDPSPPATYTLSLHAARPISARGQGVPQSYAAAAKWYLLAAEQGAPAAQLALAKLSHGGAGLPVSLIQAYKWYNLAAARFSPGQARNDAARRQIGIAHV